MTEITGKMTASEDEDDLRCPNCNSEDIERDSASPWIFLAGLVLFPIGLLFFLLNRNVCCRDCGVRFKV